MIYFDHNATSPLSKAARESWISATERFPANPSSPHRLGARAEAALDAARHTAASHLGCTAFDLVWTSGATEANNAIFHHASQTLKGEAWVSSIEHPSVLASANRWFPGKVRLLEVTPDGVVDLDLLETRLKRSRPAIISIMAANNETGTLQPWLGAFALCRRYGIPFACDAAQWVGRGPSMGLGECDFVVGCAHKFGGPLGVGFLKAPRDFRPLLVGGPQEDGRRAGTENVPAILAMAAAWSEREHQISSGGIESRLRWRNDFIEGLQSALPEVEILGERSARLWNTVAALLPTGKDCRRRWVVQLDKLGFAVSTGSACASGKEKSSHVLTAMGFDPSRADRMLRFSAGWETTEQDWCQLLEAIKTVFAESVKGRQAARPHRTPNAG